MSPLSPVAVPAQSAAAHRPPGTPKPSVETVHDAALVVRFNAGDATAFAEIVARHRDRTFAIAFGRLRNQGDAEEITQDTFIRAHGGLVNFRGEASLATWLHRITVNLALNRYWYFFRRQRHATQSLDAPINFDSSATFGETLPTDEAGPVRSAISQEFTHVVADCTARMEPKQREILRLRTILNQSYDEIARTLGIGVGTVKSRINRARDNLKVLITHHYPDYAEGVPVAEWFGGAESQQEKCA